MIRILDICSGIGGFSLGLESTGGFDTVAFCEFDDFCCKVLNKHWPDVPIYKDLKEIGNEPERIIQDFDLICGGIPCQPFSVAGKKKGKEDDRHLWPYMYEIIKHKKPSWVIVENVGGFVNVALDDVCLDLEAQGYATQSFIIPACSVEAPHRRDRVWILGKFMGDTSSDGRTESESSEKEGGAVRQSKEGRVLESKGASNVENSRRSLRQGGIEQGENGNEVGQGHADQLERSSSTSKSDVAHASIEGLEGGISGDNQGGQERQAVSRGKKQQHQVGADTRCGSGVSTKEDVAHTNDNGLERGLIETRNEDATGQDTQSIRSTDTKDISRQDHDGGDPQEPRADGTLSRSSDGGETSSSRATEVCEVSKESDNNQGTSREDGHQEDNNRTLVQEGQSRVQSSVNRGLGNNQASLEGSQVRQGDDNSSVNRMAKSKDVSNASGKGLQGHRGEHGLREASEEEQASRSSQEQDVANAKSIISNGGEHRKLTEEREGQRELGGESGSEREEDVSNSGSERGCSRETWSKDAEDVGQLSGGKEHRQRHIEPGVGGMADGVSARLDGHFGFEVEPEIPRVATGIPDRVNRLKALGNSIVPQIIRNIGLAILEEEQRDA